MEKDPNKIKIKRPGGFERNRPRVVFPVACSDTAPWASCSRSTRSSPAAAASRSGGPEASLSAPRFSPSRSLWFPRNGETLTPNPSSPSIGHCRSSEPSPSNRRYRDLRLDVLYLIAEPRFPGGRHLAAIVETPSRHRPPFIVDSRRLRPSPSSPSTRASPG